jgi:hypothetical protein
LPAQGDIEAAYVFVRPAGGWASTTETAKLTAGDGEADDLFGYQVAVSDDTIIVGARDDAVNGITDAGSAYFFDKASPLIQRSTYFASAGSAQALAGQAVATRISGDPDPNKNGLLFLHSLGQTDGAGCGSHLSLGAKAR